MIVVLIAAGGSNPTTQTQRPPLTSAPSGECLKYLKEIAQRSSSRRVEEITKISIRANHSTL